ncbi:MAG TPA: farnesyl diphosphate synthase [Candidatus Polarisedimenticolia bacterium]|jgi:geranylgeranyl diphosphate synthase type II|nr:farnesyl diphosphate synthase [Candidatus Polarisedimenticolia bacterium]
MESARPWLESRRRVIDAALGRRLRTARDAPASLLRAMRYSVLAGGKRIRPVLTLEACRAVGGKDAWALPACCALEMIHTYSLIHDDLPAMDDDDLRRGKPTAHVKFGEALAILSGDALHSLAFQILAEEPAGRRFEGRRAQVLARVARAVGMEGMVGGQVRDLQAEGKRIAPSDLSRIHASKTGALFTVSAEIGAILGGGLPRDVQALRRYGREVGLAFQIVDDVLDEEGTRRELGKSPGKDRAVSKATYPSLFGTARSRVMAAAAVARAKRALRPFGKRSEPLSSLAEFVLRRAH